MERDTNGTDLAPPYTLVKLVLAAHRTQRIVLDISRALLWNPTRRRAVVLLRLLPAVRAVVVIACYRRGHACVRAYRVKDGRRRETEETREAYQTGVSIDRTE